MQSIFTDKIHVSSDCTSPTATWPLMETTCGASSSDIGYSTRPCGMNFGSFDPLLLVSPMQFSGTPSSYIDVAVYIPTDDLEGHDFGISLLFHASDMSGCILHYRSPQSNAKSPGEGTYELWVMLENDRLAIYRRVLEGVNTVDIIRDTESTQMTIGMWWQVAFVVDESQGSARFYIQNAKTSKQGPKIYQNHYLIGPGVLRIGASFDPSVAAFSGSITCVQLHVDPSGADYTRTSCMSSCQDFADSFSSMFSLQIFRYTCIEIYS